VLLHKWPHLLAAERLLLRLGRLRYVPAISDATGTLSRVEATLQQRHLNLLCRVRGVPHTGLQYIKDSVFFSFFESLEQLFGFYGK
jgi:hypothetical protein